MQDRTISADVPPLEAAFIELFSEQGIIYSSCPSTSIWLTRLSSADVWTVNDLVVRVGSVDRSAALKALYAWTDRGVLREETDDADEQCFRLLERVPEDSGAGPAGMTAAGSRAVLAEEEPAMLTVQQQQAEQMKVFWKVRRRCAFCFCIID